MSVTANNLVLLSLLVGDDNGILVEVVSGEGFEVGFILTGSTGLLVATSRLTALPCKPGGSTEFIDGAAWL